MTIFAVLFALLRMTIVLAVLIFVKPWPSSPLLTGTALSTCTGTPAGCDGCAPAVSMTTVTTPG